MVTVTVTGFSGTTSQPGPETYMLQAPIGLDRSAAGTVEILSGSLNLNSDDTFVTRVVIRRTYDERSEVVITENTGKARRRKDRLELAYANGATEIYAVEDKQTTLRLTAARYAGPGIDRLAKYVYKKMPTFDL